MRTNSFEQPKWLMEVTRSSAPLQTINQWVTMSRKTASSFNHGGSYNDEHAGTARWAGLLERTQDGADLTEAQNCKTKFYSASSI